MSYVPPSPYNSNNGNSGAAPPPQYPQYQQQPQQPQAYYPTYAPQHVQPGQPIAAQAQPVHYATPLYAAPAVSYGTPMYASPVSPPPQHQHQQHQQHQLQPVAYGAPVMAPTAALVAATPLAPQASGGGPAVSSDGTLTPSSKYRDLRWAIFFLLFTISFLIAGFVTFNTLLKRNNAQKTDGTVSINVSKTTYKMLAVTISAAAVCAAFWLLIARHYPRGLIYVALWTSFLSTCLLAITGLFAGAIGVTIVFGIIAALQLWFIVSQRRRIAFAAKILHYAVKCVQEWPATIFAGFGTVLMSLVWFVLWLIAAVGIVSSTYKEVLVYNPSYGNYETQWQATGTTTFAYVYVALAFYWGSQVIKNVLHVTVSGVMATWYFLFPVHAVKNPTASSLKRAVSTSFGSICLGSLLVAIVRTLRAILSYARSRQGGNGGLAVLLCCLQCLFDLFERIIVYFNQYAFAQVAIYGKPYMESARATWELFKTRGFDAVINDAVIGNALTFAAWMGGVMTAVIAALVGNYLLDSSWLLWALLGLLFGYVVSAIALEVVDSAVICLFVCLAEDPAALQSTKPDVYNDVVADITYEYPSVNMSRA